MGLVSGNYNIGAFVGGSLPTAQNFSIVRMTEKECKPRVLMLGQGLPATPQPPTAALPWPPSEGDGANFDTNFQAGFTYTIGGVATGSSGSRKAAALVRLGAGAYSSTFVMDWKPGCYNLPPCTFVELAVMPWGASWASAYTFNGSIADGQMEGAHVPTISGVVPFAAGDTVTVSVPARARAVDVMFEDQSLVSVTLSQSTSTKPTPLISRDQTTLLAPVYTPPWGPVEVPPCNSTLLLSASGACKVLLQWFLQP